MIVMPANSTGWFWHCLARETGKIGHLYSPGAQRGLGLGFRLLLITGRFLVGIERQISLMSRNGNRLSRNGKR